MAYYELPEGGKCVRLISESRSPNPLPGAVGYLANVELKKKFSIPKTRPPPQN